MGKVILSIGMIVKNEIRCLEKCLKALEPLRRAVPCELVIGDTGSTDGTREIAARYADLFFDLPWENDFAAARNAVLARCSGEWYFSLDADEYLDENIEEFVQCLLDPALPDRVENYGIITICNFRDRSLDKDTATSFLAFRLARIRPETRFVGKIHEKFDFSSTETVIDLSAVVLWHDGYAYEGREAALKKCARNMRLLKEELERRPEDPLLIVQCIESSRDVEERLTYVDRGLKLIQSGAPGWEQQGASLMRYAIELAANFGLPQLWEWIDLAFARYPDAALTQVDVNAILCDYYQRCCQWKQVLKAADAYWAGIQRLDRREFPIIEFCATLMAYDSQTSREKVALVQAEACRHLERYQLANQVLQKVPLKTISSSCVGALVKLLAKLSLKTDVSGLFCADAFQILTEEPAKRTDWNRREALRTALTELFTASDPEYPCPYPLLEQLQDQVYAPAAAILSAETDGEIERIAQSIPDWRRVPAPVLKKLLERNIPFPQSLFQTVNFDGIRRTASYLVGHLESPAEEILAFTETLDTEDLTSAVWRFELLSSACVWFKWKNADLSERLYAAFCAASEEYLTLAYSPALLKSPQMQAVLPVNCQYAYGCVQAERQLAAGDSLACVHTLRDMLDIVPSMRDMVLFLTGRVDRVSKEARVRSALSPELVALAKQIRSLLARYPENDPAVFVLKSSEQYQKMKFLIEDPNLDQM